MRSHFFPPMQVLAIVVASLTLGSCMFASSSITPGGGVKVATTPAQGMAPSLDGDPALVTLPNGDLVTLEGLSETEVVMTRQLPSLTPEWYRRITLPEPRRPLRLFPRGQSLRVVLGTVQTASELLLRMYAKGDRITLISSRRGEGDSIYAMARTIDATTGRERGYTTLHRARLDDDLRQINQRYYAHFSPDSSRIVLYLLQSGESPEQSMVDVLVVDANCSPIASGRLRFTLPEESRVLPTLRVDNAGRVYMISVDDENRLTVVQHDLSAGTSRTLSKTFAEASSASALLGEPKGVVEGDNIILVALPANDDDELVGVALARFDFASQTTPMARYQELDADLLDRATGDDELENPYFHTLLRTAAPAGYLLMFEPREEQTHDYVDAPVYMTYSAGAVLMLAFDSSGEPRWQNGIRKDQEIPDDANYDFISFTPHITRDGRLQALYRDGSNVILRQYQLSTGSQITPEDGKLLLEMGGASWHVRHFTTWLDDTSVLLLCGQGMSPEWKFYTVSY